MIVIINEIDYIFIFFFLLFFDCLLIN